MRSDYASEVVISHVDPGIPITDIVRKLRLRWAIPTLNYLYDTAWAVNDCLAVNKAQSLILTAFCSGIVRW